MHIPQTDSPAQVMVVPPLAVAAQVLAQSGHSLMAVIAGMAAIGTLMGGAAGLSREVRAHLEIRAERREREDRKAKERALYAAPEV